MVTLRSVLVFGALLTVVGGCDNFDSFSSSVTIRPPKATRQVAFPDGEWSDVDADVAPSEDADSGAIEEPIDLSTMPTEDAAGPARDLALRDLASPPDLAPPPDLADPVDLIIPPDFACPPGGVCKPGDTRPGNCGACSQDVCGANCQWVGCSLRPGNECESGVTRPCGCKRYCQYGNNYEKCDACKWTHQCVCYCVGGPNNCVFC